MKTSRITLALTLWILLGLFSEIFQFSVYVYGFTLLVMLVNLIFLWIFHRNVKYFYEFMVFMYISGRIVYNQNNKFRHAFWNAVYLLAREYYWLKSKFAR